MISIDDFQKLDLRIAKIITVEKVNGSEKLVKLNVDIGEKDKAGLTAGRQVVAGIGKVYDLESLPGKEIIIVVNLEPRTLMGIESQGMLLAADDNGPVLLIPDKEVSPGSKIR